MADFLQPGVIVGDSYRVESLIGKGGMGEVWAARQLRLPNKRVAIKVLRTQGEDVNGEALQRFRREAEIISRLEHPHIVNFFDYNATPAGSPYMVMEFLEGESLGAKLRREGALSLEQTCLIVRQICSALEMTHSQGIIHRDLKPDNIFLATRGDELCVKMLDFGISKFLNANTQFTTKGVVVGSMHYMSPEQAAGEDSPLSPQSDIFSLGSMAYQMLTGKQAFEGNEFRQVLVRIMHASPVPLNQLLPDLPLSAQRAIEKALEKKPENRHASAMAFAEALDRDKWVATGLNSVNPSTPLPVAPPPAELDLTKSVELRPPRRRWWAKLLVGMLAIAMASGGAFFLRPYFQSPRVMSATISVAPAKGPGTTAPLPPPTGSVEEPPPPVEKLAVALPEAVPPEAPPALEEPVDAGDTPPLQVAPAPPPLENRQTRLRPKSSAPSAAKTPAAAQTALASARIQTQLVDCKVVGASTWKNALDEKLGVYTQELTKRWRDVPEVYRNMQREYMEHRRKINGSDGSVATCEAISKDLDSWLRRYENNPPGKGG